LKLTAAVIAALTCPPGRKDRLVADDAQQGLYVRIGATGSKSYLVKYALDGKRLKAPLGNVDAITLKAARDAAAQIMAARARGVDAMAGRRAQAATTRAKEERERLTLAVLCDAWRDLHLAHRRIAYSNEATRALRCAFAPHWDRPAEALDRRAVVAVLDGLQQAGRSSMAGATARYGRALFSWALKRGELGTANPFDHLPIITSTKKRTRVLSDDELRRVWLAAGKMSPPYGRIVRLLCLTGQRLKEVALMTWDEFEPDMSAWTIPGDRTKNEKPHLVPISEPVAAILRTCPRVAGDPLLLPGNRLGRPFAGWSKAKRELDARSGVDAWRLHDLRRTCATGMQRLGIPLEVTESALNHISGSRAGIVGIYQLHEYADEKRAALDAWGQALMALVDGPPNARQRN
jgi:integrase